MTPDNHSIIFYHNRTSTHNNPNSHPAPPPPPKKKHKRSNVNLQSVQLYIINYAFPTAGRCSMSRYSETERATAAKIIQTTLQLSFISVNLWLLLCVFIWFNILTVQQRVFRTNCMWNVVLQESVGDIFVQNFPRHPWTYWESQV